MEKMETEEFAHYLKILSEPNRIMLIEKIMDGVQCNCELGKSLSLAPNLISHHLSVLCDANILQSKRDENDARWIYYSINFDVISKLTKHINGFFDVSRIQPCLNSCGPKFTGENHK